MAQLQRHLAHAQALHQLASATLEPKHAAFVLLNSPTQQQQQGAQGAVLDVGREGCVWLL